MAGLLTDYLRESCGRAFAWGRDDDLAVDCYWWAVGWLERLRGPFAQRLREKYLGKYYTARECSRLAQASGGLEAVFAELASEAGLVPKDVAARGDLVVIRERRQAMLGICVGDKTAVRGETGLVFVRRGPVAVWGVG